MHPVSARGNGGSNTSIPIRQQLRAMAAMLSGLRCDIEDDRRDKCPAQHARHATSAVSKAIPRTIVDMAFQLNVTLAIGLDTSTNFFLNRDTATRTMPNSIVLPLQAKVVSLLK